MIEFYFDCSSPWTYLGFESIQNVASEVAAGPIHDVARAHKRRLRDYLCSVLAECGVADVETVAADLSILIDGAITSARVGGDSRAAERAARMARLLIQDSDVL